MSDLGSFDFSQLNFDLGGGDSAPASVPAIAVDASTIPGWSADDATAGGSDDIFGSFLKTLNFKDLIGAGTSIFQTVTTLDAQSKIAQSDAAARLAQIDRQNRLDDAQLNLDLAKLGYAAKLAAGGQATTFNWTPVILVGLGVGTIVMLAKRK